MKTDNEEPGGPIIIYQCSPIILYIVGTRYFCNNYNKKELIFFFLHSPEVVKSEPYGEKADVWAAGCILYQMATLTPPFHSTNMLSLATKVRRFALFPLTRELTALS